jgi:hypothetical protein
VTTVDGGSQVSLVGASGKILLTSGTFSDPRAKGATLRALKGLLGDVTVEDETRHQKVAKPTNGHRRRAVRDADVADATTLVVANDTPTTPRRRTRKTRATT